MLAFVGCTKEPAGPTTALQPVRENLEPRIRAFVERATNASGRDGSTMITADSAEWYVEAALNFSYASLNTAYDNVIEDTLFFVIPLNNGVADELDALIAYNELGSVVSASNVPDVSHVIAVNITSESSVDELVLTATVVVGTGYEKALDAGYFKDDFWLWVSQPSSACSENTQESNVGADKRIQARINSALYDGAPEYMVSVETWTVFTYNDLPNKVLAYYYYAAPISTDNVEEYDWIRDYHCYACSLVVDCSNCLSPTDMRFYTLGAWEIMGRIQEDFCPTKTAQQCVIVGDLAFQSPTLYFHALRFRYGVIPK